MERLLVVNVNQEARRQRKGESPCFRFTLPFDTKPNNDCSTILSPENAHKAGMGISSKHVYTLNNAQFNVHLLVEDHRGAHSEEDNWCGIES